MIGVRLDQSGKTTGQVQGYNDQKDFDEEFLNWTPAALLDEREEFRRLNAENIEAEGELRHSRSEAPHQASDIDEVAQTSRPTTPAPPPLLPTPGPLPLLSTPAPPPPLLPAFPPSEEPTPQAAQRPDGYSSFDLDRA